MCILFTCFYVCIDMWKEASETPSETPSFSVFPSLFFFKTFSAKYRADVEKRRVIEGGCPQRAEDSNSVCLHVFGWVSSRPEGPMRCLVRSDPGAAAHMLGTDSGNGAVPGLRTLGRKPVPSIHPNMERNNLASDRPPRAQYPVCKHNAESLTMLERLTTGD